MRLPERRGFTLVELLVVIGIISMLIALLLPALLTGEEEARQTKCKSNVSNLSKALVSHALKKNRFPGFADTRTVDSGLDSRMTIDIGWVPQIFGYIDMEERYRDFSERCNVARDPTDDGSSASPRRWVEHNDLFVCPSDPPDFETSTCPGSEPDPSTKNYPYFAVKYPLSYAVNAGRKDDVAADPPDKREWAVFHDWRSAHDGTEVTGPGKKQVRVNLDDLKDGKSNTIILAENVDLLNWTSVYKYDTDEAISAQVEFHQGVVYSPLYNLVDPSIPEADQFPADSSVHFNKGFIPSDGCVSDQNDTLMYGALMSSTLTFRNARPSSFHMDGFVVGYGDTHVDLFFIDVDTSSTGGGSVGATAYNRYQREMTPAQRD